MEKVSFMKLLMLKIVIFCFSSILVFLNCSSSYAQPKEIIWTKEELAFIQNHPEVRIGIDPEFVPYEFIDKDGEYKGIAADYLQLISARTGIKFSVVPDLTWQEVYGRAISREIDMLPAISQTPEREQFFLFSDPYYAFERVIVVKDTTKSITDINDLNGHRVAVQRNSSNHSFLSLYPQIHLSLYDSAETALAAVANGSELAFVGNLATISHITKSNGLNNLKFIAFGVDKSESLHFAVRQDWPELVSILNKALSTITEEEKIAINNKWIDLKAEVDYTPFRNAVIVIGFIVLLILIRENRRHKVMERTLYESERSKSVLLSNLPGMAYRCNFDREWTMQFVSEGCFELTGYKPESLLNNRDLSFNDLILPEYRERLWEEWNTILKQKKTFRKEYKLITANQECKWVLEMAQGIYNKCGNIEALEGIIIDITEQKLREEQIKYLYDHDYLTGLYNRRYFEDLLTREYLFNSATTRSVLLLHLRNFDRLGLTFGYLFSENLIKDFTATLSALCSNNCSLYQIAIDRYAFYITGYKDKDELIKFCESIFEIIGTTQFIRTIKCTIGVVELDIEKFDTDSILKMANIAAENVDVKQAFGYNFYDRVMEAKISRELDIKSELSEAAFDPESNDLYLEFQPIQDLRTNKIHGFEALARYKSKKLGIISPTEFIPITEETLFIIPFGRKIIRLSLNFLKELECLGYDDIMVTINISPLQLLQDDFLHELTDMINSIGVNPANIGIEITESVYTNDYDVINEKFDIIQSLGIQIAIDDFGTGYSSLARVRELNANCLKIDSYFMNKLLTLDVSESITGDIISMAHTLGHYVIAEGVEDEKQKQYLIENHCDCIQGYQFSKPLSETDAIAFIADYNEKNK